MRFLLLLFFCPVIVTAQINPAYIFKADLNYTKLIAAGEGLFGFEKDGKIGYIDKNEKVIIPAIYSYEGISSTIPVFTSGYVTIKKDGKFGMLDKTGKVMIPFEYDYLNSKTPYNLYITAGRKVGGANLYGIINFQNKPVIPLQYQDILSDSNLIALKQNDKWGLLDATGKNLLPFEYPPLTVYAKDQVVKYEKDAKVIYTDVKGNIIFEKVKSVYTLYGPTQGMILCYVSGKYGYLDMKGNEVIPTKYDYAAGFETNGLARVAKKITGSTTNYYGFIDKKGTEVIPLNYEIMGSFINGLVMTKDPETNRYGYLDRTGKWIIKPTLLDGTGFDDAGGAWVKMTDAKYHYINKAGKDFGAFNETTYKSFNKDGYAVYENTDNSFVLLDKAGKPLKKIDDCDAIYSFVNGFAGYKCKSTGKYGFLDTEGNKIVSCEYDGFDVFSDGLFMVNKKIDGKTKYGFIDNKGNIVIPIVYENAQNFRDGWGIIKKDSNYFFIDKAGNLKEPPRKYNELSNFRSGYAIGTVKGVLNGPNTYYYLNTQLKEEFSVSVKQAYLFWGEVAVVTHDSKTYELMNKKGEIFKTLTGIETLKFTSEGMLAVKENGKWGFINEKGDYKLNPKYDDCDSYKYGYAKVKIGMKWGIIDKSGTEIIAPIYENIIPGENGMFVFYDKAWGVIDKSGKVIVEPILNTVTPYEKDRALAKLGKSFIILKSPLVK